jgi:hypothetical protein
MSALPLEADMLIVGMARNRLDLQLHALLKTAMAIVAYSEGA